MSTIVLKTAKRSTSVPRSKVRRAVTAVYARTVSSTRPAVAVVTKRASSKAARKAK